MIIIEGSDLVGKTSFAKALLNHKALSSSGYIYKHFSRLPTSFDFCAGYMNNASKNSVQDRFHMSEPVYSLIRRESESALTPEKYRLVDAHLRLLGAYTVVITCKESLLSDRMRADEMYDLDQILQVNREFSSAVTHDGPWRGYQMDWDCHIHCNENEPFPTDQNVEHVIGEYLFRQSQLSLALEVTNDGPHFA